MATNYDSTVSAFYLAYYGRPADPAGLAYWSQALAASNGDFGAIISAFSTSPEATSHFSSDSATDHVTAIYEQLFGRAPDAAGLAYWTAAIGNGSVNLADAAIQIMSGAQSSDVQVSTLRQEAAAQFTADVAASGIAYDGAAAVDAARVLISAVNANSSAADIKSLVTASASLVQVAHDNPAIITALAAGGDLTTLLTSASGKADPVGLVQALATLGKAAVSDPSGLTTLLHGGGVAGLIASLPAGTSLTDVTQAVDTGGLSAGATAANPPPPDTTAPDAPTVQLVTDTGVSATDHITSNGQVKISGLEADSTWEYSTDGTTWLAGPAADQTGTALLTTTGDGAHTLLVRSTDDAGNVSPTTTLAYTLETTLAPRMVFALSDGTELAPTATLETNTIDYLVHVYGTSTTLSNATYFQISDTGADGSWTTTSDSTPLNDGIHYIRYVFTDAAGNVAATNALRLDMDTVAPAQGLALASVNGVAGTNATEQTHATVVFSYTGTLDIDNGEAFFYHVNGGNWTRADASMIDTVNKTVTISNLDVSAGDPTIYVEAKDAAGNVTDLTQQIVGPHTTFHAGTSAAGMTLTAQKDGNIYLTDADTGTVHQILTTDGGGAVAKVLVNIGVQQAVAQGVIGVGPSADVHTNGDSTLYSFGTNGADTQKGQYVWGYDGDDTIVALGGGYINGGNGADTVDATAGSSKFAFASAQESNIVADDTSAHGFDTITVNTTTDLASIAHTQGFSFTTPTVLENYYGPLDGNATLTGSETGNALLALINTAVNHNFKTGGTVQAAFVDFHVQGADDVNFLVVDTNGDGMIDSADYAVKIIGTIDIAHSSVTKGLLTLPTA